MNLVIWGSGGHGKVVIDCARAMGVFDRIAVVDDSTAEGGNFCGYPVLGDRSKLSAALEAGYTHVVVAIGDNAVRCRCYEFAVAGGLEPVCVIHPSAVVSPSAVVGRGTVVMPGAVINACARIGCNCVINTGAVVEHDCRIGDHVFISPRAALGGAVTIGDYAHIGLGAAVLPLAGVAEQAIVGAGAVVLDTVGPYTTVVGVPARALARSRRQR
jgi:UDP-perosamine 4-acetyltransferase